MGEATAMKFSANKSSGARWIVAIVLLIIVIAGIVGAVSYYDSMNSKGPGPSYTTAQESVSPQATDQNPDCSTVTGHSGTVARFCLWITGSPTTALYLDGYFNHGQGTQGVRLPEMIWHSYDTQELNRVTPDQTGEIGWSGGYTVVIGAAN